MICLPRSFHDWLIFYAVCLGFAASGPESGWRVPRLNESTNEDDEDLGKPGGSVTGLLGSAFCGSPVKSGLGFLAECLGVAFHAITNLLCCDGWSERHQEIDEVAVL